VVEAFAVLHPTAALVVAAVAVRSLPRRAGALAGVGIPLATTAWIATVPAGVHLQTTLFGFDVVLFYVDPVSRTVGTILAFVAAAAPMRAGKEPARPPTTVFWTVFGFRRSVYTTL